MAIKKVYVGNEGPFLYDDTTPINDGDFPGVFRYAIVTNGSVYSAAVPVLDEDVVRKVDLADVVVELTDELITGPLTSKDNSVPRFVGDDVNEVEGTEIYISDTNGLEVPEDFALMSNAYWDGASAKYKDDGYGGALQWHLAGGFSLYVYANGVADAAISAKEVLDVSVDGDVRFYRNIEMDEDGVLINNGTWDGANVRYIENGYGGALQFHATGGFSIYVYPSGTAGNVVTPTRAITILSGANIGYVGINESTPTYRLHVGGSFHADSINVNEAYSLPTAAGTTSQFLRGDGTWAVPSGAGDVTGPGSSTDNAIARFHSTTGKVIQNSVVTIGDTGIITINGAWSLPNAAGTSSQFLRGDGTWAIPTSGAIDKIEEGNSYVEVIDAGTGEVTIVVDGTERVEVKAGRVTVSNALSVGGSAYSSYPTIYSAGDVEIYTGKNIMWNAYWDGSNARYSTTGNYGGAVQYHTTGGMSIYVYNTAGTQGGYVSAVLGIKVGYNGSVGIGVSSPSSKLDVNGDVEINGSSALYFGDPSTDSTWRLVRSGTSLLIQRRESSSWVTKSTISA